MAYTFSGNVAEVVNEGTAFYAQALVDKAVPSYAPMPRHAPRPFYKPVMKPVPWPVSDKPAPVYKPAPEYKPAPAYKPAPYPYKPAPYR